MNNERDRPYERVQLFSGGGSRFGYYLGSYAALVSHDLAPDIVIGTCGGSLSAYLVQLVPDPKDLQALMCSRELYRAITAIRHVAPEEANRRLKMRYITSALKRWQWSKLRDNGQRQQQADSYERLLEELQQLAMFRIDNETEWLDGLSQCVTSKNENSAVHKTAPEIAIIASRLYQQPIDALYDKRPVLQELLFAPPHLARAVSSLTDEHMTSPVHLLANGRIHPSVKVQTQWDFASVVRASLADMYYLAPIHMTELGWCLGGVINLTPIELACQWAETVFAETKAEYDSWLAAPAIQRVFGFDPNARLAQVHSYQPMREPSPTMSKHRQLHWLPFADNAQQLPRQNVQKRFSLKQMTVALIHSDYDGFVQQMQAQWQYGYQRTTAYIQQQGL